MDHAVDPPLSPKPHRLALVVGSGGVRATAALGVADVLRQAGIGIDLVVGCSAGALIGGGIAMQLPTDEAMRRYTLAWQPGLAEKKRWRGYLELLVPRWAGFGPQFALRDARAVQAAFEGGFDGQTFETLPTPLRVVTTDAATGQRHIVTRGRVADAVLASTAVPFLFPSVPLDGRRLMDGVLSDPLPVSVAHDASVVLALGADGPLPRRVDRASRLAALVSTSLINNLQAARTEAARANGQRLLMIELELERRVGLFDTHAMPMLLEAGRQAAARALPQIRADLAHADAAQAAAELARRALRHAHSN